MPVNDRRMGRGAKIASGTVRDSLHMIDVIFGLDGGELPEIVVTDTGSYSEVVFGLLELLGSYRPAPADLTDKKGWRIRGDADYGRLNTFGRSLLVSSATCVTPTSSAKTTTEARHGRCAAWR
jgi:hypothetical protein